MWSTTLEVLNPVDAINEFIEREKISEECKVSKTVLMRIKYKIKALLQK